ncbi:Ion-translocating oxidoreductase complex subunit E, partial [Dysosmobacter welbionis]
LRTSVRRRHLHRGGRGGDVHRQRHRPHRLHHECAGYLRLLLHRRLRLQEVPHPQGRRHRSGPGHCLPHRGDAAVELSHHAHLHGNGSRGNRGPHADPGVPALQPGEGRPEHGADPAALQAGGHRPAEGPAGTGVPCACRGQGQAERRVPPVLPGPAGNLCGAGPGADGDSVNLNTTGAGADTVPAPFTAAHIRPSASPRRYVKTFPSLLPFQ